jgi:fatty acid-binding protein DegV
MLKVKITLAVQNGVLGVVRPVRGSKSAMEFGLRWIEERMAEAKRGAFCVMHAMSESSAEYVREEIVRRFEPTELHVAQTGTVIATHTGRGWGVAFVPEE